jgi:hypothetical protein
VKFNHRDRLPPRVISSVLQIFYPDERRNPPTSARVGGFLYCEYLALERRKVVIRRLEQVLHHELHISWHL